PLNDVDFFAPKFADNRLDPRSLHADARADGIDILLARRDCDLRALAGFPGDAFDLYSAVVDLRYFRLKQMLHQFGSRSRADNLRSLGCFFDLRDNDANAIADGKVFKSGLIALAEFALGFAQFHDDVAVFEPLDDTIHDFADVLVIFGVDALTLGFAN